MTKNLSTHNDLLGAKVVEALQKNDFTAEYVKTAGEARERLLAMIPDGAAVGFGGSITISGLDIQEELAGRNCKIYDHIKAEKPEEKARMRINQLTSDIFLCSSNAITLDGKLYNVDGNGNRVAAMIFGPKQVIVVAGINKVVKDLEAADARVRLIAAPTNALRVNGDAPCTKTGYCTDCSSPSRICKAAVTLHKKPTSHGVHVILVGETLGY
ncbi:MAG: lactate utilization protein [Peptococcaceae bacterium]|nr:lactate utilization protein [Peptococcaceae bacterium]